MYICNMKRKREVLNKKVNNVFTQRYGGYKMYCKLYAELKQMHRDMNIETNVFQKIWMFIWGCLLKPLGSLYKYKTRYKGVFEVITDITEFSKNTKFINKSVVKSKTHYLFGIPFWYTSTKNLTDEDEEKLID